MTLEELKAKRNEQGQKAQQLQDRLSDLRREGEKAIRETRQEFDDAELECQVLDRKIAELEAPPVDRSKQCTVHHQDPEEVRKQQQADPPTGQHADYIILCEEERAKGYVRPLRDTYVHVGVGGHEIDPNNPARHGRTGNGCGVLTRMPEACAETWARDIAFYSHTFCVGCNRHLPVAEFVWEDGTVLGS